MVGNPLVPAVRIAARRSRVLTPSTLTCLATLPTINLTKGCLHDCAYCYIRGYSGYTGAGTATLYADTPVRLERELSRMKVKPRAVYFSPSSDLFQPDAAILRCAEETLSILLRHNVGVSFLTKGVIPESIWALLEDHTHLVQAQIGLLSLDDRVAETFEPSAASPAVRLAQMRRLVEAGIATAMRLDPILPGVTDDPDDLRALFAAAQRAGVTDAAAGILFVRPGILGGLRHANGPLAPQVNEVMARYRGRTNIAMRGAGTAVGALSAAERSAIFDRVQAAAAPSGIRVRVCACKNADIASGSCNIAGKWPSGARPRQLDLLGMLRKDVPSSA